jgi:hypothetical protein
MKNGARTAALASVLATGAVIAIHAGFGPGQDRFAGAARRAAVETLAGLLDRNYVLPDVATTLAKNLRAALASGAYEGADTPDALADRLTADLREWSHDKHLRVATTTAGSGAQRRGRQGNGPGSIVRGGSPGRGTGEPIVVIDTAPSRDNPAADNFGFQRVEILDGNIGYAELRGFRPEPAARDTASAAMAFLANSRAIIIDLRRNTGGSPEMVRYLASYFFDERPVVLNRFFDRPSNTTTDQTTLVSVPGRRMPAVPLYILTSRRTFSAGEGFTYSLKALKRATVVGEVTGGGAHPSADMPIGSGLVAFVPVARSINPVTGTDWEGTGGEPDITADADQALETAIRDALRRIGG